MLRRCLGQLLAQILDFGFELGVFPAELVYGELELGVLLAEFEDFIVDFTKVLQEFLIVSCEHDKGN